MDILTETNGMKKPALSPSGLRCIGNIMQYKIVSNMTEKSLQNEVNKYIKQGWEPVGGVLYSRTNAFYSWHQSMVLKDEDKKSV